MQTQESKLKSQEDHEARKPEADGQTTDALNSAPGAERFAEADADRLAAASEVAAAYKLADAVDVPKTDGATVDQAPRPGHVDVAKQVSSLLVVDLRRIMLETAERQAE